MKILVGIPTSGSQTPRWWTKILGHLMRWTDEGLDIQLVTSSSASPDKAKNIILNNLDLGNQSLTAANRNRIVSQFDGDYLFFIDHDTVPPPDALPRLLSHGRPFVSGVYHFEAEPNAPLIYNRVPNGLYKHVIDYEPGALIEVDAVGMGCALIHRSVFEAIHDQYIQFMRPWGSRFLVHRDDIFQGKLPSRFRTEGGLVLDDGLHNPYLVLPIQPAPPEVVDGRDFPFFEQESGRTEDFGFCERAERCGYKPIVDTLVVCQHWKLLPVTDVPFLTFRDEAKVAGVMPSTISEEGPYAGT